MSTRDEWPVIGAALGFPLVAAGDASRPPRCAPAIANRLQQLYNDILRHFDQAYISNIIARLRSSQASGQLPPQPAQPQGQPHQPTKEDYQALLGSITSESSVMNSEAVSLLPLFSRTSGADLEVHHVPPNVIAFVEQNREHLQREAQGQNGFRDGLTSTKNAPLDNRAQVNHGSALLNMARPPQFMPGQQRMQQLQRRGTVRGPRKPNPLKPAQLFNNVGSLAPPSTAQSISASSIPPMDTQITGSNPGGGVQNQGGPMSVEWNREHLQRAAQDQNGPGKSNVPQPAQLFNSAESLVPPSAVQTISASSFGSLSKVSLSQASGHLREPPQPKALAHQPTEADYQANNTTESFILNTEATEILPSTVTPSEKLHPTLSCWIKT